MMAPLLRDHPGPGFTRREATLGVLLLHALHLRGRSLAVRATPV